MKRCLLFLVMASLAAGCSKDGTHLVTNSNPNNANSANSGNNGGDTGVADGANNANSMTGDSGNNDSDASCDAICGDDDGCCPASCTPAEDPDCVGGGVCGDAVVEGGELCDPGIASGPGSCPTVDQCPTMDCALTRVFGSVSTCNAECAFVQVVACQDLDGCCAPGCDVANDDDCVASCGNGVIERGELCDGNCPASCDDGNACTTDTLTGSAASCDARCFSAPIGACIDGDGCCPPACSAANDNDCSATCGNGAVDANETCDPPGVACITSCDDGNVCTSDTMTGTATNCNVACGHLALTSCNSVTPDGCCPSVCNANNDADCMPVCPNGVVERPEQCDGNCQASCDDGDVCTTDTTSGSASDCSLTCGHTNITTCIPGDGCCPTSCNSVTDSDCGAVCGNGILEPPETCDQDCPATCDDSNACTRNVRTGTSTQCNVVCSHPAISVCADNDGCCPSSCTTSNDSDCGAAALCGNGVVDAGEICDGNCPTAQDCQSQGVCKTLGGSAAMCNAQCIDTPGCVACDLAGSCPCTAGQECLNGQCFTSGGFNCTAACDQASYCAAWGGPGAVCNTTFGGCVTCLDDADCGPLQYCNGQSCDVAPLCEFANDPAAWCVSMGQGNQCTAFGSCESTCSTSQDCPDETFTCRSNGVCDIAVDCNESGDPNLWCQNMGLGTVCVDFLGLCYDGCPTGSPCSCPMPDQQECLTDNSGNHYCDKNLAPTCVDVCPAFANNYCEYLYPGIGSTCSASNQTVDRCDPRN